MSSSKKATGHSATEPEPAREPGPRVRAVAFERGFALLCLAVAAFVGLRAESLVSQSSIARTGAFPAHGALWIAAGVLGISSAVWTVQAFRRNESAHVPDLGRVPDVLVVLVLLLVGAWSTRWLGLLPAAGLTYIALMLFYRDRGWLFVVSSLVGYLVLIHYGLEVLLGVALPRSSILPLPF
ncbi:MAG: tripartite tricarboxylate transporter TctB family protein [Nocardioidaceae bacterium]